MTTSSTVPTTLVPSRLAEDSRDWLALPGGELEAPRPKTLCSACRERLKDAAGRGARPEPESDRAKTLCFRCYRTQLESDRRLKAAAELNTASEARFQSSLPFEPVNRARLNQLRAARQAAREDERQGAGVYVDKRRRAQIAARHALQNLAAGLKARGVLLAARTAAASVHVAAMRPPASAPRALSANVQGEMQIPAAWLPFVTGR
jgi:hypothetical protein